MSSDVPVGALDTTFTIVQALQGRGSVGVSELAAEVDIPPSTVFNHLKTLEEKGYLVNENGRYRLGCRFLKLGAMARSYHDIYAVAREEVDELARKTGEMSATLVEEHGLGVFLHRAEGERAVHIDSYTGQRINLHGAALGKAILAELPRESVEAIVDRRGLPALTESTITDRATLFDELERIRETGVAFDDQERLAGLRSVAVPLTDDDGTVLGSVSVAGPTNRVQGDRFRETLPERLRDVAKVIELEFIYS